MGACAHRHHAYGAADPVIKDHRTYLELGSTERERQHAYQESFRKQVEEKKLDEIRRSIRGGLVLGEDSFKDEIERVVARCVRPGKGGRPRKVTQDTVRT